MGAAVSGATVGAGVSGAAVGAAVSGATAVVRDAVVGAAFAVCVVSVKIIKDMY